MLVPSEIIEAMELEHRAELAKARMQVIRYRKALEDHGIEPPDADGDDFLQMWRDCSSVISTASDFVANLGSAKELLRDSPIGAA